MLAILPYQTVRSATRFVFLLLSDIKISKLASFFKVQRANLNQLCNVTKETTDLSVFSNQKKVRYGVIVIFVVSCEA
jgi:hypothetical protein